MLLSDWLMLLSDWQDPRAAEMARLRSQVQQLQLQLLQSGGVSNLQGSDGKQYYQFVINIEILIFVMVSS